MRAEVLSDHNTYPGIVNVPSPLVYNRHSPGREFLLSSVMLRLPLGPTPLTPDSIHMVSMESFSLLEGQLKLEPRVFYNLTTGTVSSAYGTFIILAISFAIAAIGGLLYYGLQNMSSTSYGYDTDSYNYQRSLQ